MTKPNSDNFSRSSNKTGLFKASNPDDLFMFRRCFSFTPEMLQWAREKILSEQEERTDLTEHQLEKNRCTLTFKYLPSFLNPAMAHHWCGTFHFIITDLCEFTLTVENGKAVTRKGLAGRASCVIKADMSGLCAQIHALVTQSADSHNADSHNAGSEYYSGRGSGVETAEGELTDSDLEMVAGGKKQIYTPADDLMNAATNSEKPSNDPFSENSSRKKHDLFP
ncbi:MAG: hypothetical protein CVV64_15805 [Candidatus Wallbacteria bacterium HGW-Wallbacteria-1]|jgi:hypothetical protein|uniref:Uncharacterized protein n=1 Tax=Candidatus Wallbacteria bacterium HGW-Wallbacteria-1 TaxID=2013854 RepID=A0A2N1PL76_9BACT|nr:MAG: hypothetical protein CVV64_15805 [Candidatus Wallbacteria bacterium HGW-Wallbacteria-1]